MKLWQKFVTDPTGELKPVPKITTEPEVWYPKGEILVKEKLLAKTLLEGKPTKIFKIK